VPEVDPLSLLIGRFDGLEKRLDRLDDQIDNRFRSHGERVGKDKEEMKAEVARLEERMNHHMEKGGNPNGNNWRTKGVYAGGGVLGFEALHRIGGLILEALKQ